MYYICLSTRSVPYIPIYVYLKLTISISTSFLPSTVVNNGSIIEQGTHDQLKDAGGGYSTLLNKYMKAVTVEDDNDEEERAERDNVFYTVSTKKMNSMRQLVVRFLLSYFLPVFFFSLKPPQKT